MDINSLPERAKKVEKETKTFSNLSRRTVTGNWTTRYMPSMRRYSILSIAWTAEIAAAHWDHASRTVISNVLHRHCVSNHMKLFNDICISMKIRSMYSVQCLVPSWEATIYCSIYEDRPKACREYPHTDRKKFYQIHALTIKNAETCPAVFHTLEQLKQEF